MNSSHQVRVGLHIVAVLGLLIFVGGCATAPRVFDSPEAAADALISASRAFDMPAIRKMLGSDSDEIISSGDAVADRHQLERFVGDYDQKHRLEAQPDGSVSLVVGDQEWPLPIPIVKSESGKGWYFDAEAGKEEIINRRIGRNELDVIETCKAIVDAQREYAMLDPNGDGVPEYAEKFLSDPGKKNGLYWPVSEGETPSPLGPIIAEAAAEGYKSAQETGSPTPYHGYYYRMLKAQGPAATGGAFSYVVEGKLIGGFALVAYPAGYGTSGIMTFIVNHEGKVYQADLGEDTEAVASKMTEYNPDDKWEQVTTAEK